jgi:protein-S-isoprenylcysteine O-methyltransferase Ste14
MVALHFFLPVAEVVTYPWVLLGLLPLLLGILLNVIADQAFKTMNTTVKPFEESTALITEGVFRITRNPMYLGMVLMLFGIALLMGTLTPFVVGPVFAVLMEYKFIKVEERMLADRFGERWTVYQQEVRRWI